MGEQCFKLSLCIHIEKKNIVDTCSQYNGYERKSEACSVNIIISGNRSKLVDSDSGEMFKFLENKQNMLILCVVGSVCMQSVLRDGQGLPYCLVLE